MDGTDIAWEPVDRFPDPKQRGDIGAYRGMATELIVTAHRPPLSIWARLLRFIAGNVERSYWEIPKEVALTREWIFVVRRNGRAYRIHRKYLARSSVDDGTRLYRFVTGERLLIEHDRTCKLEAQLESQLNPST